MTLKYSQMHFKMFKSRASLTLGSFRFKNGTRFSKTDIFKYFLPFLVRKAHFRPKMFISGQFVHFQSKKLILGKKCSFLNNSFIFSQKTSFSAKNAHFWTIRSFSVLKIYIYVPKCFFFSNFWLKNIFCWWKKSSFWWKKRNFSLKNSHFWAKMTHFEPKILFFSTLFELGEMNKLGHSDVDLKWSVDKTSYLNKSLWCMIMRFFEVMTSYLWVKSGVSYGPYYQKIWEIQGNLGHSNLKTWASRSSLVRASLFECSKTVLG